MPSKWDPKVAPIPDSVDRWSECIPHHPMSEKLMAHLKRVDHKFYDYYFDWRDGGDGDNGETLMYQMDSFFEALDRELRGK